MERQKRGKDEEEGVSS